MTNRQPQPVDTSTSDYEAPDAEPQVPSALPDPDRNLPVPRQSHFISSILTPALRLWLRSQVEQAEDLHLLIEGGDRQLLRGLVPRVTISARDVIYQGLFLSQLVLVGRGIKVNFGQLLKGKPLQLERTVPVQCELRLTQEDLNDSLKNPLLANAITDFLINLLEAGAAPELVEPSCNKAIILDNLRSRIEPGRLVLGAEIISATQGTATPFIIRTGLRVSNGRELCLENPEWLPTPKAQRGLSLDDLDGFPINLGTDVDIQELVLEKRQLTCRGKINIVSEQNETLPPI